MLRALDLYRVCQIADRLDVSLDWLLGRSDVMDLPKDENSERAQRAHDTKVIITHAKGIRAAPVISLCEQPLAGRSWLVRQKHLQEPDRSSGQMGSCR